MEEIVKSTVLCIEYTDGFKKRLECDEKGRLVSCKNSDGEEHIYKYDKNGNRIEVK